MNNVSVLIPALNEEKGIGKVIVEVEKSLCAAKYNYEIIVIDDGSEDKTSEIAKQHKARIIRHPMRGGYGLSLRDGILNAKYEWIVIIDADQSYPANRTGELVSYLNEFDMVIGARTGKIYKESLLKYPMRLIFHHLCEFVAGMKILDANSGFRAFRKESALRFQRNFCLGFSFTTTITLAFHLSGLFVKYVPIDYYQRAGKSHVKLLRDSLRTTQIIVQAILYYNPIKLFLLLWAITFIFALMFLCVYCWTHSMLFLMLGHAFLIVAFLYLGIGFLADMLKDRNHSNPGIG